MNPYEETADTLRDFLRREGYRRCDIPACNCGSWHGRDGLHARWREVKDALAEAGHPLTNANGNTPLRALGELVADRDRLRGALEWLRGWRTKDHESIDCCIEHALGQAETCSVCHPHGNAALAGGAEAKRVGCERDDGALHPTAIPHTRFCAYHLGDGPCSCGADGANRAAPQPGGAQS